MDTQMPTIANEKKVHIPVAARNNIPVEFSTAKNKDPSRISSL